jgi:hypothetical protein
MEWSRRSVMKKAAAISFLIATASVLLFAGEACGDGNENAAQQTAAPSGLPKGSEPVELDPLSFTVDINNRYWPMEPGTRWTYSEVDEEGKQFQVVITASTETKKIANGIAARVVRDTVTEGGKLVEDTIDWYAQDAEGNIWYLGEDTAEFADGKITSKEGSWEAGVDGALPGVIVPGAPADDMKYRQEYYAGQAEDNGEVLSMEEQVEVPAGHFSDALLTKDTTALEPKVLEYKLYAPTVGPALIIGVSGGTTREELVSVETVAAAAARAAGTAPLGESYP